MVYRHLDENRILATLGTLGRRIEERFPGSGLARVSAELLAIGGETHANIEFLRRPHWPLRVGVGVIILATLVMLGGAVVGFVRAWLEHGLVPVEPGGLGEVVQSIEALVQDAVFLGIAIWFVLTIESRIKRRRALEAVHQLRTIAHIVDMHQLTKDPERLLSSQPDTASSPARNMTRDQLGRYLDYCSELLSLTSKLAALYVQNLNDPVVLEAVSDVESLAAGLSNKIWQKITLLDQARLSPVH